MCHFHQKKIVQRYITNNPKLYPGKALKLITEQLSITDSSIFEALIDTWYCEYEDFLMEKHFSEYTQKYEFVHERLINAYASLKRNMPFLYTYQDYPELEMPNTTNSLESVFGHLKQKVNLHRGLRRDRKIKLISELLSSC
jgi:hypothetical protein